MNGLSQNLHCFVWHHATGTISQINQAESFKIEVRLRQLKFDICAEFDHQDSKIINLTQAAFDCASDVVRIISHET